MERYQEPNPGVTSTDPVAAVLVTQDRRLRQAVLDLAASAGIRVHPVGRIPDPLLPQPPLHLFGPDAQHLTSATPPTSSAVFLTLQAPVPAPAPTMTQTPAHGAEPIEKFHLPAHESQVLKLLVHAANTVCRMGTVIVVSGVTGGAGTTTAALLFAGAAASLDHETSLIEGAGPPPAVEFALGLENAAGIRWPDLINPNGQLRDLPHPEALRLALARWRSIGVLARRGVGTQPQQTAVTEITASLARLRGIVIMDGGTPHRLDVAAGGGMRADISVLVIPRTVSAVVQAHELIAKTSGERPLVMTRARRGGVLSQRDVERALGTAVVGELPEISGLQNLLDRGTGLPGPRARCWKEARSLLHEVLGAISAVPKPNRLRVAASS